MKPSQIVVARYKENIEWLSTLPEDIEVVLYNKFFEEGLTLPNIGREAHTYLHHIIENYDNLADVIAFVQGNPYEHCPTLNKKLINIPEDVTFGILTEWIPADNGVGAPWGWGIPYDEWYEKAFGEKGLDYYVFGAGAQFVVSREQYFYEAKNSTNISSVSFLTRRVQANLDMQWSVSGITYSISTILNIHAETTGRMKIIPLTYQ